MQCILRNEQCYILYLGKNIYLVLAMFYVVYRDSESL